MSAALHKAEASTAKDAQSLQLLPVLRAEGPLFLPCPAFVSKLRPCHYQFQPAFPFRRLSEPTQNKARVLSCLVCYRPPLEGRAPVIPEKAPMLHRKF